MPNPMIKSVNSPEISQPAGHYTHATIFNGTVYVAGQLPITATGEKLVDASFEVQAKQVLHNVKSILEAAGSSVSSLLQVRVYVASSASWGEFNKLYAEWAGDARPARCVVPVGSLHHGLALEMEVTAALDR